MGLATAAFFFSFLIAASTAFQRHERKVSDLSIINAYGKGSPFAPPRAASSWRNTVFQMASKDLERISYLSSMTTSKSKGDLGNLVPIAPGKQMLNYGNYLVQAKIGSPGQRMFMVFDISNDIAWIPCRGCTNCSSTMFSPNMSYTYQAVDCTSPECIQMRGLPCSAPVSGPCLFNQSYAGDSLVATMSHDSLKLGTDIIMNYAFGCINNVSGVSIPPQGLLGLGRGSMSLLFQAKKLYSGMFSYCLPSFKSFYFSGSLKLGPGGQPDNIQTTPLLKNPIRPTLYYVNLLSISVNDVLVPMPSDQLGFDIKTGAGTIIDSGTVVSRFVQPVYTALREEVKQQVSGPFGSLGVYDTCFNVTYEFELPTITFHFEGMDMELPLENTYIHSSSGATACLAMAASPNNVNINLNIIANFQQQNMRVMIDSAKSVVGIARELCN